MSRVVLVVEDEPLIGLSALAIVEEAGYEAVEARNADEAITILERRADVRVVFTDVDMPGTMDGLRLAKYIRDRWPPIFLIVASGKAIVREGDLPLGALFFPNPTRSTPSRIRSEACWHKPRLP
jgi:CheY-like chemotaxis protein